MADVYDSITAHFKIAEKEAMLFDLSVSMDPASQAVKSRPLDASDKTGSIEVNEATLLESFLSIPSIDKAWTSSSWRGTELDNV